jgi:5-methylcytosine-specific restriction enzyme subunit McrC
VIRRTILEWGSIGYGDGVELIPAWAADRLAAVARRSPLGGRDGESILSHGRTKLRARQVVGVIAAEGCALEILPKIDGSEDSGEGAGQLRRRLVQMLAVSLDLEIASGEITALGWQRDDLLEILIGLFGSKLADAVRVGRPQGYRSYEEDLPVLRGRLDVVRQFTTLAANTQGLACRFDARSADIALNQIMKAAVRTLYRISRSPGNQRLLRELDFAYDDVTDVPVKSLNWDAVAIDRTNARWRELLNLARLLLAYRFQDSSMGASNGFSLLFEMNTLFEEFIARMLRRGLAGTDLSVRVQGGRRFCLEDVTTGEQRFMTKPDILLERDGEVVLIIDTKWKRLSARIDDPKQGVSQGDVYQMMAYGQVYRCSRLLLLYPHHADLKCSDGLQSQHRICGGVGALATATLNLSVNSGIARRLKELVLSEIAAENGDVVSNVASSKVAAV